ncbi:hypothetical protein P8V03_13675 [Clostridium sp. A1-XYC3]|uniref:SbsA Ig-like domain-containing protein n=1 Tax=Clostridium tanneri TaxID=3037988 RepID=A0ABU4JWA9_9CLOT|nr:hypothetical protein [Clostridium sp. A1-XYC3]MDW8802199.1 hypothetical protein [Clostridium sp. A1-XYC3]
MLKTKLKSFIIASLIGGTLLIPGKVQAFQVNNNQTVDANKVWTITFTDEVGFDDLTKKGIKVLDKEGNAINVTLGLGADNKSIIVIPPQNGYKPGESYKILVDTAAHSKKGKAMKQQRVMDFNIKTESSSNIGNKYVFTSDEDLNKKEFIDLKSGEVIFDGNDVTAKLALRHIPDKLVFNSISTPDNRIEYSWEVKISDGKNQYILWANHTKFPGDKEIELPLLNGVQVSVDKVDEGSFLHQNYSSLSIADGTLEFDKEHNSLILHGQVPGLDVNNISYIEVESAYDTIDENDIDGDYSSDKVLVLDKLSK